MAGFPWWFSSQGSTLPVQGAQVQFRVREVDSHMPQLCCSQDWRSCVPHLRPSTAKKINIERKCDSLTRKLEERGVIQVSGMGLVGGRLEEVGISSVRVRGEEKTSWKKKNVWENRPVHKEPIFIHNLLNPRSHGFSFAVLVSLAPALSKRKTVWLSSR